MGSNFEKTILILNGDKTKSGIAIKALAMDLDEKFDELDKKNDERHEAILSAIKQSKEQTDRDICSLKTSTDERFTKLKPVMVISENWKLIVAIVLIALILVGLVKSDEVKNVLPIIR